MVLYGVKKYDGNYGLLWQRPLYKYVGKICVVMASILYEVVDIERQGMFHRFTQRKRMIQISARIHIRKGFRQF